MLQQTFTVLRPDGLGMELHAINRVAAVLHGHDLGVLGAVGAPGGDDEIFGQGGRLYDERVVAHAGERARYTLEQLVFLVDHLARLGVHQPVGARPIENPADVLAQPGLAPIVPGGLLGARRLARAGGLEQRVRRGPIVVRMALRRQPIVAPRRLVARILFGERSRHVTSPLTPADDTAGARCAGSPGPRGCRAVWSPYRRTQASPGPTAGPSRPRQDSWWSWCVAYG